MCSLQIYGSVLTASIWSSGNCAHLVFTKPGHAMWWLPEQIGILDHAMKEKQNATA